MNGFTKLKENANFVFRLAKVGLIDWFLCPGDGQNNFHVCIIDTRQHGHKLDRYFRDLPFFQDKTKTEFTLQFHRERKNATSVLAFANSKE